MLANKEKNFVSIVVYLHKSKDQLPFFLETIERIMNENFEKYEFVFIDDDAQDGSVEVLKQYFQQKSYKHLANIIHMSRYHGLEPSMNAGRDLAIGDFVFEFDDLNIDYTKELIMQVYRKSLEGFDIVSAVPDLTLNLSSRIFYNVFNWARLNQQYKLQRETFRVLSRRAINRVKDVTETIPYRKANYLNCGLPYTNIRYRSEQRENRRYDASEVQNRKNLAMDSLILFTDVISKVTIAASLLFLSFAVFVGVYTVWAYCGQRRPVEGWAPLMGALSVGFAGIFLIFTVIIKYLSLILNMIFKKRDYLIKNIEKITK